VVIKAQVLAGGRGKGHFESGVEGGVRLAHSPDEVQSLVSQMIGSRLITKQTGAIGRPCTKVMICEKVPVQKEFYFAILLDRAFMGPVLVGSGEGGVNIEEIASQSPDKIIKDPVDINEGLSVEKAQKMAEKIGFSSHCIEQAGDTMMNLYKMVLDKDVTMLEINPLVETTDGRVLCMDAKINFDDNAEYRQKEIFKLRDWTQEDPRDTEAARAGINYIGLDGSIGCMVNGAGLAMATMDMIKLYGGSPANFLDIGGGASPKEVMDGFHILSTDPNVRAIFVNVFGGIIKCDMIAKGIIAAATEMDLKLPLVVRLQGNNQMKAKAMIEASNLRMLAVEDFNTAAKTVVNVCKISELANEVGITVDFSSF
jgi:succinyl-CoA synthetase beta subunit